MLISQVLCSRHYEFSQETYEHYFNHVIVGKTEAQRS